MRILIERNKKPPPEKSYPTNQAIISTKFSINNAFNIWTHAEKVKTVSVSTVKPEHDTNLNLNLKSTPYQQPKMWLLLFPFHRWLDFLIFSRYLFRMATLFVTKVFPFHLIIHEYLVVIYMHHFHGADLVKGREIKKTCQENSPLKISVFITKLPSVWLTLCAVGHKNEINCLNKIFLPRNIEGMKTADIIMTRLVFGWILFKRQKTIHTVYTYVTSRRNWCLSFVFSCNSQLF